MRLSAEQIERFEREGYLFFPSLFKPEEIKVLTDEVPAFVRFEGPLHPAGAVWRIELTSPRWPD